MFCVNNAIYANDIKSAQLMQQICVLTTDKTLIFYEYNGSSGQYKFEEDKNIPEKALALPKGTDPIQIQWDNDLIYISSKKGYLIFNKNDCNTILQQVALVNQLEPKFCLCKTKTVILNHGNCGFFLDAKSGQKKHILFKFDKYNQSQTTDKGQIVQILMHEIYVIVVFETCIAIFNSQSGDFLEEKGVLDRFKYKAACLNHTTGDVLLVAHNNSKANNTVQTKICQLSEIPAQDQIDYLLSSCRIQEARDIFNLKENKGDGDFTAKTNQFDLDIGWIRLTKMMDFPGMLNDFKRTDLDPREMVLLYKNLLVYNHDTTLKRHFTKTEFTFDITTIIDRWKMENDKMATSTDQKVTESKGYVIQILEHKN